MNEFSQGPWSLLIIFASLGGLAFCWMLLVATSKVDPRELSDDNTTGHVWDDDLMELNNPLPRWWLIMFYVTLGFGALYLVLYPGLGSGTGFLSWSSTKQYEQEMAAAQARYAPAYEEFMAIPAEELVDNAKAVAMGSRLYAAYCTGCHGSDAGGNPGIPSLRDSAWQWGKGSQQIRLAILNGRQGVMPAWGAALGSDEAVQQTAHYVLSLSGVTHDVSAAKEGKAKFEQMCVACHGQSGEGNPQVGGPALNDSVSRYGNSLEAVTQSIAKGRQGVMPGHSQLISEAKAHVLSAFILSLSPQP